jgi:hypothetical protein
LYADIFGQKALAATSLLAGQNLAFVPTAFGAAVVNDLTTDGAVEANMTSYFLNYSPQPTDPPVNFSKSNANQTVYPLTDDCTDIVLQ